MPPVSLLTNGSNPDYQKVNKAMKLYLIMLVLFLAVSYCFGDNTQLGAVNYYANKYGHEHPDTVQIVQVDFNGDGSSQFIMTFAKRDWAGPESGWTVVELKNGQWGEPRTLGFHGEIVDFSAMAFDPDKASFVYLPSYKRNGLITRWRKNWTFTYLENDTLTTVYFWTPSQVGLADDAFKQLMDSKKVTVIQKQVP